MSVRPAVLAWSEHILRATEGTTLDPALVAALIDRESNGVSTAINPSGATGLMQVKPYVHRDLIARVAGLAGRPSDHTLTEALIRPDIAIEVGVLHLSWCVRSGGSEERGLSKYHVNSYTAGTKADSAGTTTASYVADILALRDEYAPHFAPDKETPMPMVQIAGLPNPVPLDVPFRQALIPPGQTNQRPGTRMVARYYTQHDTGNTRHGANAEMHRAYMASGADGQQLGYHFTVDDREIIQMIPVNEMTWHAGDRAGPGNHTSIASELCINEDGNEVLARRNAAKLAAVVMDSLTLPMTNLVQHNHWSGKDCPHDMRSEGFWPAFVSMVAAGRRHSYVEADLPDLGPWDGQERDLTGTRLYACRRLFTVTAKTPVTKYASGGGELRAPLVAGDYFMADYVFEFKGVWFALTPFGSRINLTDCTPTVSFGGAS